jgi:hypothetical protein
MTDSIIYMRISVEENITLIEGSTKYEHSLLVARIMEKLAKHSTG